MNKIELNNSSASPKSPNTNSFDDEFDNMDLNQELMDPYKM